MLLARLAEFHEKNVFSHYFKQFELNAKNNGGRLGVDEFTTCQCQSIKLKIVNIM